MVPNCSRNLHVVSVCCVHVRDLQMLASDGAKLLPEPAGCRTCWPKVFERPGHQTVRKPLMVPNCSRNLHVVHGLVGVCCVHVRDLQLLASDQIPSL